MQATYPVFEPWLIIKISLGFPVDLFSLGNTNCVDVVTFLEYKTMIPVHLLPVGDI